LACIDCNLCKGANLTGIDPSTGSVTLLFDPRNQQWDEHFKWRGYRIIGRTDVGRATVNCLDLNSNDRLMIRLAVR
jgi:hypothetical protein